MPVIIFLLLATGHRENKRIQTTTMVTSCHQDQRRSQRTEVKQRQTSLGPISVDEENDTEDDTDDELGDETEDEVAVVGDEESDGDCDRKKSAVFLHLLSHPKCLQVYDDFSFSVLCRARYASQLKVLEAVCIRLHKPDLCKQKKHVVALKLFS